MPIPLIFIGIAAVTGATGIGKTIKAGVDQSKAKQINTDALDRVDAAVERLDILRKECGTALADLGSEKVFVLNENMMTFVRDFEKLKNVDFRDSVGLSELSKMHIDQKDFAELGQLTNFAFELSKGTVAGVAGGAATAMGAYSAAGLWASASTGTAIASLHGAAATNATLAFFGGGSLATGGLGVAGGTAVLGGLVAGPALLVMGIVTGAKAGKNLENAKANLAQANEICEELEMGADQCIAIRRRTNMFYYLLTRLDAKVLNLIYQMKSVLENEGDDYSLYTPESKKVVVSAAAIAVTIKSILDTPILNEDGSLTETSETVAGQIEERIEE